MPRKRLEAIESLEELGAGFMLATHDLEIRGAGELLGEEQSGQIQEIGFALYMELLERAVNALQCGQDARSREAAAPRARDGPARPVAAAGDLPAGRACAAGAVQAHRRRADRATELDELQAEMIDRFGLLPRSGEEPVPHRATARRWPRRSA